MFVSVAHLLLLSSLLFADVAGVAHAADPILAFEVEIVGPLSATTVAATRLHVVVADLVLAHQTVVQPQAATSFSPISFNHCERQANDNVNTSKNTTETQQEKKKTE